MVVRFCSSLIWLQTRLDSQLSPVTIAINNNYYYGTNLDARPWYRVIWRRRVVDLFIELWYLYVGSYEIHFVIILILLKWTVAIYLSLYFDWWNKCYNEKKNVRKTTVDFKFLFISQEIRIHLYIPSWRDPVWRYLDAILQRNSRYTGYEAFCGFRQWYQVIKKR